MYADHQENYLVVLNLTLDELVREQKHIRVEIGKIYKHGSSHRRLGR